MTTCLFRVFRSAGPTPDVGGLSCAGSAVVMGRASSCRMALPSPPSSTYSHHWGLLGTTYEWPRTQRREYDSSQRLAVMGTTRSAETACGTSHDQPPEASRRHSGSACRITHGSAATFRRLTHQPPPSASPPGRGGRRPQVDGHRSSAAIAVVRGPTWFEAAPRHWTRLENFEFGHSDRAGARRPMWPRVASEPTGRRGWHGTAFVERRCWSPPA